MSSSKYTELVALRLTASDFRKLRELAERNSRKVSDMARIIVVSQLNHTKKERK